MVAKKKIPTTKCVISERKALFNEMPYYNYTGSLIMFHGQFNNSLMDKHHPTKYELQNLPSLYDINLFDLITALDSNISPYENLHNNQVKSRYFSPHVFHQAKSKWPNNCFSVFHNNITSLNQNLENLKTHILEEIDFHFDIIGISETKINNANLETSAFNIPGYRFEFAPTPLSFGGVGLFIDEQYNYRVIEKTAKKEFQALWIEISFFFRKKTLSALLCIGSTIIQTAFCNISKNQWKSIRPQESNFVF